MPISDDHLTLSLDYNLDGPLCFHVSLFPLTAFVSLDHLIDYNDGAFGWFPANCSTRGGR